MEGSLREKSLNIARLKAIFGIKTESARRLRGLLQPANRDSNGSSSGSDNSDKDTSSGNKGNDKNSSNKDAAKGHGHRPASDYQEAQLIKVTHETLRKGSICPGCGKGKLFNLAPGSVLRIVGQPWLNVSIYKPERLRCPTCGQISTAKLPEELCQFAANCQCLQNDDTTAKVLSLMKENEVANPKRQGMFTTGILGK